MQPVFIASGINAISACAAARRNEVAIVIYDNAQIVTNPRAAEVAGCAFAHAREATYSVATQGFDALLELVNYVAWAAASMPRTRRDFYIVPTKPFDAREHKRVGMPVRIDAPFPEAIYYEAC